RLRIDHAWDDVEIHMACLPCNDLGNSHAFILCLMCKHWALNHVANSINAFTIGAPTLINSNATAFIQINARFLQAQPIRIWTTTSCHQNHFSFQRLCFAAFNRLKSHLCAAIAGFDTGYLRTEFESDTLLFQQTLELLGYFA